MTRRVSSLYGGCAPASGVAARCSPPERGARLGSVGEQLGERGGGEHARGPELELLAGRGGEASLHAGVDLVAEALAQQAQQQRARSLLEAPGRRVVERGLEHRVVLGEQRRRDLVI